MLETTRPKPQTFVPTFSRKLPAMTGAEVFGTVLQATADKMAAHGFIPRDVFAVRLSLEEALCNAARHGNKVDAAQKVSAVWEEGDDLSDRVRIVWPREGKAVRVAWTVTDQRIRLSVEDEGPGFDPGSVPDPTATQNLGRPSGRGLLLMRHYMTRVVYLPPGNCLVMSKDRTTAAPTGGVCEAAAPARHCAR